MNIKRTNESQKHLQLVQDEGVSAAIAVGKPLMTVTEVRVLLRFKSDSAVHKLVQRGRLGSYRLGGNGKRLLFRQEDVQRFLEQSYRPAKSEEGL